MVQPQGVFPGLGHGGTVLTPEGFRVVQEFPHLTDVQALLVQLAQAPKSAHNPGGEGGSGGEIQQELGDGQSLPQGQANQIPVGNAVACKGHQHPHQVHQQPLFLTPQQKIQIGVVNAVQKGLHPVSQAENADIFGKGNGFRFPTEVTFLIVKLVFFVPMGVVPVVLIAGGGEFPQAGQGHEKQQPSVQAGQNGGIQDEPADVGQQGGQRPKNLLRCFPVAAGCLAGLALQPQKRRGHRIGIGGGKGFQQDFLDNGIPNLHKAEAVDLLQIGLAPHGEKQCQGEKQNGTQKILQGRVLLYQGKNPRGDVQLAHVCKHIRNGYQQAEGQPPPPGVPAGGEHPADVLQEAIGLFWFF